MIDGCSQIKAFWHIIFPLLRPSVSAVVILNGFGIWNNYSQAVFFLQSSEKHNVPQALSVYFQHANLFLYIQLSLQSGSQFFSSSLAGHGSS